MSHFKEIHFIPQFVEWLGDNRSIQEMDYPRFFGKTLSKNLSKHLKEKMIYDYCSPKQWGGVLCSYLPLENGELFSQLVRTTQESMTQLPDGIVQLNTGGAPHITWHYLRECNEALWTRAWNSLRESAWHQFELLDPWVNYRFVFKGIDVFPLGAKKKSYVLYLKPNPETEKAIIELGNILCSLFSLSGDPNFFPHLTLGKITEPLRFFDTPAYTEIQNLWKNEEWVAGFDHALFFRHLDHEGSYPVFGVALPGFGLPVIQKQQRV